MILRWEVGDGVGFGDWIGEGGGLDRKKKFQVGFFKAQEDDLRYGVGIGGRGGISCVVREEKRMGSWG